MVLAVVGAFGRVIEFLMFIPILLIVAVRDERHLGMPNPSGFWFPRAALAALWSEAWLFPKIRKIFLHFIDLKPLSNMPPNYIAPHSA